MTSKKHTLSLSLLFHQSGLFIDEKRSVAYLAEHSREFMNDSDDFGPDGNMLNGHNGYGGGPVPMEGVTA